MRAINKKLLVSILEELENDSMVTQVTLAKKYEVSERTIRRYMLILKNEGKIKLIKSGKIRYWKV